MKKYYYYLTMNGCVILHYNYGISSKIITASDLVSYMPNNILNEKFPNYIFEALDVLLFKSHTTNKRTLNFIKNNKI